MVKMATTSDADLVFKINEKISFVKECHIWEGGLGGPNKYPTTTRRVSGKYIGVNIQRFLWRLHIGKLEKLDVIETSCPNKKCLNVEHFIVIDRSIGPNHTTSEEEITSKISKNTRHDEDCHIWTGDFLEKTRRTRFSFWKNGKKKIMCVQRYLWRVKYGELSQFTLLETSCGNNKCVNVDHLRVYHKPEPTWDEMWEQMKSRTVAKDDCLIIETKSGKHAQFKIGNTHHKAPRASYIIKTKGAPIPETTDGEITQIRHLCGDSHCVNPTHLEAGSILVNNYEDKIMHGTLLRGEKHPMAKITQVVASEIKGSKRNIDEVGYETQSQRAERFGVKRHIVSSIDTGSSWANVPDRFGNITESKRERNRHISRAARERIWTKEEFEEAGEKLYSMVELSDDENRGDVDGPCWNFTGDFKKKYGIIPFMGKQIRSHILSCEIKEKRHKREEEITRHLCGNPKCVNPQHLTWSIGHKENAIDTIKHGSVVAKLNEENVKEIRGSSLTTKELSNKYNISYRTVRSVITRTTWKHVV